MLHINMLISGGSDKTYLYIIHKCFIAHPNGNFVLDVCWISDGEDVLVIDLHDCKARDGMLATSPYWNSNVGLSTMHFSGMQIQAMIT